MDKTEVDGLIVFLRGELCGITDDIRFFKGVAKRHRGKDIFFLGEEIIGQLVARKEEIVWKLKHYRSIGQKLKESSHSAGSGGNLNSPQG